MCGNLSFPSAVPAAAIPTAVASSLSATSATFAATSIAASVARIRWIAAFYVGAGVVSRLGTIAEAVVVAWAICVVAVAAAMAASVTIAALVANVATTLRSATKVAAIRALSGIANPLIVSRITWTAYISAADAAIIADSCDATSGETPASSKAASEGSAAGTSRAGAPGSAGHGPRSNGGVAWILSWCDCTSRASAESAAG